MTDLISVIVPVYNVKPYIQRCLDSLLAQTHKSIEIIAIDDGSNDGTENILDNYASKYSNIRVIRQANSGVTAARLRGVSEANGDWIGFMDSDDYIEPEMYSVLYNNALAYDADISHCGYQLIHLDGNRHFFYNTQKTIEQDNTTGLKDLIEGVLIEPGLCNKLFKKTLFDSFSSVDIDKNIKINEDLLINYFLFKKAKKSIFFDFCPYHYFARATSASRNPLSDNHIFDPIKVRNTIVESVPVPLFELAKRQYIVTCLSAYSTVSIHSNRDFRDRLPQLFRLFKAEKKHFHLLSYKYRLLAYALLYLKPMYPLIYRFAKLFSKKDVYY